MLFPSASLWLGGPRSNEMFAVAAPDLLGCMEHFESLTPSGAISAAACYIDSSRVNSSLCLISTVPGEQVYRTVTD
jgi:hypothetical protein